MMIPNPVMLNTQRDFEDFPAQLAPLRLRHHWDACWLASDRILIQHQQTLCQLRPRKQGVQLKFVQGEPRVFHEVVAHLQEAL